MSEGTIKVFISYTHDSEKHCQNVLDLSEKLRKDGIETTIDRYINGAPPEGWPRWMSRQVEKADFVLVVCSETYLRRYKAHETPGKGLGGTWEGGVIQQELYEAQGHNTKFVPVYFEEYKDRDETEFIPTALRSATWYELPQRYDDLYFYLTSQPEITPVQLGSIRSRPIRQRQPKANIPKVFLVVSSEEGAYKTSFFQHDREINTVWKLGETNGAYVVSGDSVFRFQHGERTIDLGIMDFEAFDLADGETIPHDVPVPYLKNCETGQVLNFSARLGHPFSAASAETDCEFDVEVHLVFVAGGYVGLTACTSGYSPGAAHGWSNRSYHCLDIAQRSVVDPLDPINLNALHDQFEREYIAALSDKGAFIEDDPDAGRDDVEVTMSFPRFDNGFQTHYQITTASAYTLSDDMWDDYTVSHIIAVEGLDAFYRELFVPEPALDRVLQSSDLLGWSVASKSEHIKAIKDLY